MRDEIAIFNQQRCSDHLLSTSTRRPPGSPDGPSLCQLGQLPPMSPSSVIYGRRETLGGVHRDFFRPRRPVRLATVTCPARPAGREQRPGDAQLRRVGRTPTCAERRCKAGTADSLGGGAYDVRGPARRSAAGGHVGQRSRPVRHRGLPPAPSAGLRRSPDRRPRSVVPARSGVLPDARTRRRRTPPQRGSPLW